MSKNKILITFVFYTLQSSVMEFFKRIIFACLITLPFFTNAQNIGINTTGAIPNASSILDVSSSNKGLLIPRVSLNDLNNANPITGAIESLLVYNTNSTTGKGFYFWNTTKWINLTDNTGNADEDWYEVGTTNDPDNISDNIFSMGKVSIGVNTTSNNLEVSGNDDPVSIRLSETTGTDNNWELRAYNVGLGTGDNQFSIWGGLAGDVQTDRLVITKNGNVGIGLVAPVEKLHISGGTGKAVLKIEADSDNSTESDQAYILLSQDGGTVQAHLGFGSTEATGDMFRIAVKGPMDPNLDYNTFVINGQNGRVGIGTSNPTNPLSVFGSASKTTGGDWAVFSDSTLKKNITNYNEGLSLIMKLKLHNFSYNRKYENIFGGGKSLNNHIYQGVIAQELELISPDMVEKKEVNYIDASGKEVSSSFLQVDPSKFTYTLINATKEQQDLIESLNNKVELLEKRLIALEKLLK